MIEKMGKRTESLNNNTNFCVSQIIAIEHGKLALKMIENTMNYCISVSSIPYFEKGGKQEKSEDIYPTLSRRLCCRPE